jgi:hypothetical protein
VDLIRSFYHRNFTAVLAIRSQWNGPTEHFICRMMSFDSHLNWDPISKRLRISFSQAGHTENIK